MKRRLKIYYWSFILGSTATVFAGNSPKIITGPNQYYFTSGTYQADVGATNAVISVNMIPGTPAWGGSVGYYSSDGTGIAGRDYTSATGVVWLAGPAGGTFNVPLHPGPAEKTVQLHLFDPENDPDITQIRQGFAILTIPATPPSLTMNCDTNCLCLSWDSRYTNYIVESTTNFGAGPWVVAGETSSPTNGVANVKVTANSPIGFFRLRKQQ